MATYTAPRMQTNAGWSVQFRFVDVDMSAWQLSGRAQSTRAAARHVDLVMGEHLSVDGDTVSILLDQADCGAIGQGMVQFEVMRDDPEPRRPILRFQIENNLGVTP